MPETPDWNAPLEAPVIQAVQVAADAGEAITTPLSVAGVAGRAIVVTGCSLLAARTDQAGKAIRTTVQLIVSDNLVAYLTSATIGPEHPTDDRQVPPGTLVAAVGNAVAGQVLTEPGGGTQSIIATIYYYLR